MKEKSEVSFEIINNIGEISKQKNGWVSFCLGRKNDRK